MERKKMRGTIKAKTYCNYMNRNSLETEQLYTSINLENKDMYKKSTSTIWGYFRGTA